MYTIKATQEDLSDPAPWSNLSAVYFEAGKYLLATKAIKRSIHESKENADVQKAKLALRMIKSCIHCNTVKVAKEWTLGLQEENAEVSCLNETIQRLEINRPTGQSKIPWETLITLPRYRPAL